MTGLLTEALRGTDRDGFLGQQSAWERIRTTRRADPATLLFVVLALLFGGVFSVAVPQVWGPDEPQQFYRAYQVAHGGFLPLHVATVHGAPMFGGQVPRSVEALKAVGPWRLWDKPVRSPVYGDPAGHRRAEAGSLSGPTETQWFTNTAAYAPLCYLPQALALRAVEAFGGSIGDAIAAMRLAGLAAYTLLVGLAVYALRSSTTQWLAVVVGLLPPAVFQAAVISADTLTNGVSILFLALVTRVAFLHRRLTAWQTWSLLAAAITLPVLKPTSVVLLPLLLLVRARMLTLRPGVAVGDREEEAGRKPSPAPGRHLLLSRAVLASATLAGLALTAWWARVSAPTGNGMGWVRGAGRENTVRPAEQASFVVHHPWYMVRVLARTAADHGWRLIEELLSQTGYNVQGSAVAACLSVVALLLVVGITERLRPGRWPLVLVSVVLVSGVGAVFGALYLGFNPVGLYEVIGVQGRYFIPLALLALVLLCSLLPLRLDVPGPRTRRQVVVTVAVCLVLSLTVALAKYVLMTYVTIA
ncbi:MAG TPA: DUF2142 domain-containing protein [Oryzihumus sp.]|jgi:hypothetical protein